MVLASDDTSPQTACQSRLPHLNCYFMLNHDWRGSASSACLQHFMIQPLTPACTSLPWRLKETSPMTFPGILRERLLLGSKISSYDQSSSGGHWIGWHSRVWIRDLHGTRPQALVPRVDVRNYQLNRAKGQSRRWWMLGSLFWFHFPDHLSKPFVHAVKELQAIKSDFSFLVEIEMIEGLTRPV